MWEVVCAPEKTLQGRGQTVPGGWGRLEGLPCGLLGLGGRSAPTWANGHNQFPQQSWGGLAPSSLMPSSFPMSVRVESGEFYLTLFLPCENFPEIKLSSALYCAHFLTRSVRSTVTTTWADGQRPKSHRMRQAPPSGPHFCLLRNDPPDWAFHTASKPASRWPDGGRVTPALSGYQRTPGPCGECASTSAASRPPWASDRRHYSPSTGWPAWPRIPRKCLSGAFPSLSDSPQLRTPPVW